MGRRSRHLTITLRGALTVALLLALVTGSVWYLYPFSNGDPQLRMVSGTEYISGEEGQIIIRLANDQGPMLDASCNATLLFPDKSYVFIDRSMQKTSVPGNYYVSFTTPSVEGVYEQRIACTVGNGEETETLTTSDSFHVSPGLNMVQELSVSQRRQFRNLSDNLKRSQQRLRERIENVSRRVQELENKTENMTREVERELDKSINERFENLSDGFAETARAMEDAFATE